MHLQRLLWFLATSFVDLSLFLFFRKVLRLFHLHWAYNWSVWLLPLPPMLLMHNFLKLSESNLRKQKFWTPWRSLTTRWTQWRTLSHSTRAKEFSSLFRYLPLQSILKNTLLRNLSIGGKAFLSVSFRDTVFFTWCLRVSISASIVILTWRNFRLIHFIKILDSFTYEYKFYVWKRSIWLCRICCRLLDYRL